MNARPISNCLDRVRVSSSMRVVAILFSVSLLVNPGAAAAQALQATTPDAPAVVAASSAGFGGVAAVGDGEIFIGSAPIGWQTGDEPPGTVYRYVRDADGQWKEAQAIAATDGSIGDDFGRSVFYHAGEQGEQLVVGASGVGAAYVFEKHGDGWMQMGKLTPSRLGDGAEFAGSYARAGYRTGNIAVAGDRIAVTSFGPNSTANAVHVFRKNGQTWTEEAILKPSSTDESSIAGFANSIAATDNTIFVSANAANDRQGTVYVYRRTGDGWKPAGTLAAANLSEQAGFGSMLAFDGADGNNTLYVGAPGQNRLGAVIQFTPDGQGGWKEAATIARPEAADDGGRPRAGFGSSVAASNGAALIGGRGVAYIYDGSVTELTAPDDRSQPGFGAGLAIRGKVAVIGSPSADYEEGISTVYEHMVARGGTDSGWIPVSTLASELSYFSSIYGEQINCEDGSAGVFGCDGVDMLSFMSSAELTSHRGVKMTDIWGWEDPATGKEWVILGRTDGTAFVDISNPNNPVYVGQLYRTEGSPGSAWRDMKVYKNHAFIVADGANNHGTQIFDLTQLRDVNPADMPVTFKETAHYDGTASTHNIVINEETGFAYAVGNRSGGNNTCGGQLHIFDISNPVSPKFAGCYSSGQGGTHDAQCVVYRGSDREYVGRELCFASNGNHFAIGDVTDKDSTFTIANTSYPNRAYTHQGWLSEDHNYFYMNDELDEMNNLVDKTRTLIWDVTDLDDPQLVKEFLLDSGASDHNLYIRDNLMYQSNYQAGLRILDISDPVNPVEVGNFDTAPYAEDAAGFGGSWSNYPYFKSGVIAVSSRSEGLFILKKRTVDL